MFKIDEDKFYSMPVMFGGIPVRQKLEFSDCRAVSIVAPTRAEALERYIPEGFALIEPRISYTFWECRNVSWMRTGGFACFCVGVPVTYVGNDEGLSGVFPLAMWEDNFHIIISSREESGIPALYSPARIRDCADGLIEVTVGEPDAPFVSMCFRAETALSEEEVAGINAQAPVRQFGWRFIPNIAGPGAAISQPTVSPFRGQSRSAVRGTGTVSWHADGFVQPGQGHIVRALSGLPKTGETESLVSLGSLHFMPELARPLA